MAKKLLDQAHDALRSNHYSYRTEQTYLDWMCRYILFHDKRHPKEMGVPEINQFITHLVVARKASASTLNLQPDTWNLTPDTWNVTPDT
jgi:hypothetical protein